MDIGNRTIWMLWFQGFDAAPPLVRACLQSWRRHNPGWHVVALDRHSLHDRIALDDVIALDRDDLTIQTKSDIVRLCLLRRHGGVWADATAFCFRPLDAWLCSRYTGFAAFANPGRDRLMSNWFIAAENDNPVLLALYEMFIGFLRANTFPNQQHIKASEEFKRRKRRLKQSVEASVRWLKPGVQARVGAAPYFLFHYCFNKVMLQNPDLRAMWEEAALERRDPARLKDLAKTAGGLAVALREIEHNDWLLQKLNWRVADNSPYWRGVTDRLAQLANGDAQQAFR